MLRIFQHTCSAVIPCLAFMISLWAPQGGMFGSLWAIRLLLNNFVPACWLQADLHFTWGSTGNHSYTEIDCFSSPHSKLGRERYSASNLCITKEKGESAHFSPHSSRLFGEKTYSCELLFGNRGKGLILSFFCSPRSQHREKEEKVNLSLPLLSCLGRQWSFQDGRSEEPYFLLITWESSPDPPKKLSWLQSKILSVGVQMLTPSNLLSVGIWLRMAASSVLLRIHTNWLQTAHQLAALLLLASG